jgi:hypothetical protein
MGNDTSKATGTDFGRNQKTRMADTSAEDLPSIPYLKQKKVTAEISVQLKGSVFMANFKRAYRGYLRKSPERNQMGTMFRIHQNSLADGDALGMPKDSYEAVIDRCVVELAAELTEDVLEFLTEKKKVKHTDTPEQQQRKAEESIFQIFKHMTDQMVQAVGKKLYEKYSRGADFQVSDVEADPEKKAKMDAAKAEKLKKAAADRHAEAARWLEQAKEEEANQTAREEDIARRQEAQKAINAKEREML